MAPVSPTVAGWELANRLRARRQEMGIAVPAIAERFGFTRNYWWAVESDKTVLAEEKLRGVAEMFELDEAETGLLFELREATKQRGWWAAYGPDIGEVMQRLYGLEHGAESVRAYEGLVVTGLLQTADYARALIRSNPDIRPVQVDRLVDIRLKRQERLRGPDPIRLDIVLSQATLLQQIGGPAVLRAQLEHLVAVARELTGSLQLQVRPFTAPAGGVSGASTLYMLSFASPALPVVAWQESMTEFGTSTDPKLVKLLELSFAEAVDVALGPDESLDLIERCARELC